MFANLMNGNNIGVVESCRSFGFVFEPG